MFVMLNQLKGPLLCLNVKNIKEFYPQEFLTSGEEEDKSPTPCVVVNTFSDDTPWVVTQTMTEVYELCRKAKMEVL